MRSIVEAFAAATQRGIRLALDLVELHAAHGYLLSSFLSPLANHRTDEYGGSIENRMRFPLEVFRAMRTGPGYQVPFAARIRKEVGIPTMALGLIRDPRQADEIVAEGKADLVAIGRGMMNDPRWPWHAAEELGAAIDYPVQYERGVRRDGANQSIREEVLMPKG